MMSESGLMWVAMSQESGEGVIATLYYCDARKYRCYAAEVIDAETEECLSWTVHDSLGDCMGEAMKQLERKKT